MSLGPTPYAEVNAVLRRLLTGVQAVLGKHFIGLYLYGSLASGDFQLGRSDIDFVVVTNDVLPAALLPALEALHSRLAASELAWATRLEGAYLPRDVLRRHDPEGSSYPCFNEGRFRLERLGPDWVIQRHILREHSVVVAGPDPRPWIDPVTPDDLRRAVRETLQGWWAPMLTNPAWLDRVDYRSFAVLTMCRGLYALEYGAIVSKTAAAQWARGTLGERWSALIDRALAWQYGMPFDALSDTLALIEYVVARSQPGDR